MQTKVSFYHCLKSALFLGFALTAASFAISASNLHAAEKAKPARPSSVRVAPSPTPTPVHASALKAAPASATAAPSNTVVSPQLNSTGGFYGNFDFLSRKTFGDQGRTTGVLLGTAGYTFARSFNLTVTGEFDHAFVKTTDRDPNNSVGDTTVSLGNSRLHVSADKTFQVFGSYGATLPTSRTSQKASLKSAHTLSLGALKRLNRFTVTLSGDFTAYDYKYETADIQGFQSNETYSSWTRTNIAYALTQHLNFENRAAFYLYRNYAHTTSTVYRLQSGFSYSISPSWFATAQFRLQDRLITTNPFFDQDTRSMILGLSFWF